MQTDFAPEQLAEPKFAESESVIRKCVHCGFCTATCPTYVLLGNELDSPRGRIYLMKDMLEQAKVPDAATVKHIDRCLSCLSCRTTCPSGVDYMRLVDHARAYVEEHYRRPWHQRAIRALLAAVLPHPRRFAAMARLGRLARPLAPVLARSKAMTPLAAMLDLAPDSLPATMKPQPGPTVVLSRVAILRGCAESVLQPQVRAATERVLARIGVAVVPVREEGCCGALVHHLGREDASRAAARRNIDAWWPLVADEGLEAIIVTASGCGSMVKDYGHLLREDPVYADRAATIAGLARDVSEYMADKGLPPGASAPPVTVAYHPACSLQHGQGIKDAPLTLLRSAGYMVSLPRDSHLCCGSAGTYNILQPDIAGQLGVRKVETLEATGADVVATGNIGCATQIARGTMMPVVHIIELIDWALGGPDPRGA